MIPKLDPNDAKLFYDLWIPLPYRSDGDLYASEAVINASESESVIDNDRISAVFGFTDGYHHTCKAGFYVVFIAVCAVEIVNECHSRRGELILT